MFFGTQRPLTEERRLCWMGSTATTENKAIYRRIIAAIGEGDERILRELLAADLIHPLGAGMKAGATRNRTIGDDSIRSWRCPPRR